MLLVALSPSLATIACFLLLARVTLRLFLVSASAPASQWLVFIYFSAALTPASRLFTFATTATVAAGVVCTIAAVDLVPHVKVVLFVNRVIVRLVDHTVAAVILSRPAIITPRAPLGAGAGAGARVSSTG